MSFNYHDIHSQLSVTNQPQANINLGSLDFKKSSPTDEKSFVASLENSHYHHCELEHGQNSFSNLKHHTSSHTNRLKRFLLSAIFSLVALCSLLALSCVELHGLPPWEVEGADLMGRALDVETRNSTLVTQKINNSMANTYLSLIIIGMISLVLLIIILLTACIYPVAFLNPWCCPCFVWDFLCCCQGLACIEYICHCCLCSEQDTKNCKSQPSWEEYSMGVVPTGNDTAAVPVIVPVISEERHADDIDHSESHPSQNDATSYPEEKPKVKG